MCGKRKDRSTGGILKKTLEIGGQIKVNKASAVSNGRGRHFYRVSSSGK